MWCGGGHCRLPLVFFFFYSGNEKNKRQRTNNSFQIADLIVSLFVASPIGKSEDEIKVEFNFSLNYN